MTRSSVRFARRLALAATSTLALSCALSSAALAETAAGSTPEIVVVGTPLDQSAPDVLQGVTKLDRADVLATLGQGLGDTLDRQPGVASTGFAAGATRPIIRGLGEDRIRVLSHGIGQIDVSTVSPDHAVTTEGLEADSIEILRGPAAIAYGGNAVGGVVNVIDGRIVESLPSAAFGGQVYGGVTGGLNAYEIAGRATANLGAVVLRLEGFERDNADYEIPGFAFTPAAREDAIAEGADPDAFAQGRAPNSDAEARSLSFGASWIGDWGFVGIGGRRLTSAYGFPEDEVIARQQPGAPFIDLESTRYDLRFAYTNPFWIFTKLRGDFATVDYEHSENEEGEIGTVFRNEGSEGRLEFSHAGLLGGRKGVLGVSGLQTKVSAIGEEAFLTQTKVDEVGVFGFQEWTLNDVLMLEGGLRVDRKDLSNIVLGSRDFTTGSVSVGLGYRPADPWFLGVTLARTERAPTELELFANGAHKATQSFEVGDADLSKETALSLEAKARYEIETARIEASVFHIDYSDFIALIARGVDDIDSGLPIFDFRAADATFTGAEITGGLTLIDGGGWTVAADAGVDLVRAKFDRGGNIPRIPPLSWTLGLDAKSGPFAARVEYISTDDQTRTGAFETATPGYDVVNARLTISPMDDERFVFMIDARNLTDEEIREATSFTKDLLPRPGRSVRVAVSSKF